MGAYNAKEKIVAHYDFVSPFYHDLWGEHLHHGYWRTGEETKEAAQQALVDHVAAHAAVQPGDTVLDVGCGCGGSSIYLAQRYKARPTGITISPVQVEMSQAAAARGAVDARFLLMDAQAITLGERFDVLISIESVSHYENKGAFFRKIPELLKDGGRVVIVDWFRREDLSAAEAKRYIEPIEKGMLVELHPVSDYCRLLETSGVCVDATEDLSSRTERTWRVALDILNGDKSLWRIAKDHSPEVVWFLRAFRAMKAAYDAKTLVYAMIVAHRNGEEQHGADSDTPHRHRH